MSENLNNIDENNLEAINKELSIIQHQITNLRNQEYNLNSKKVELDKDRCRKNIGRCFIQMEDNKIVSYCRIIDIDKPVYSINHGEFFNECQYPSLWFSYPYNNSSKPFYKDKLFSGAWGEGHNCLDEINKISYVEISKEELLEKFKEVNALWIKKMSE